MAGDWVGKKQIAGVAGGGVRQRKDWESVMGDRASRAGTLSG